MTAEDEIVALMRRAGVPVTRENFIDFNWGEPLPTRDEWTLEDEEQLPDELQDLNAFALEDGEWRLKKGVYPDQEGKEEILREWLRKDDQPRVPAGSPEGGQFTSDGAGGSSVGGKATFANFEKAGIAVTIKDENGETLSGDEAGQRFADAWSASVGIPPDQFKSEFIGGPGTMELTYRQDENRLEMKGVLTGEGGKPIGEYANAINFNEKTAEAGFLEFDEQGKGHAKAVLAANVATYQKMGLERVELEADIEAGRYAWARYGFVPSQDSWDTLRESYLKESIDAWKSLPASERKALNKLIGSENPKAMWAIADHARGKDLLLGGGDWFGTLDFGDAQSMKRFEGYVAKGRR